MDNANNLTALIGTLVTVAGSVVGLIITISKHHREINSERSEILNTMKSTQEALGKIAEEVAELRQKREIQQKEIELTKQFAQSHFRMSLFNSIVKALNRGYTSVYEATEVTKMYTLYRNNGGNGEIEILFIKFDKLEVKEDDFETH